MIRHVMILGVAFLLFSCARPRASVHDVTEEYLREKRIQIGYCEYQGADRATGERKVLYLRTRGDLPARLILRYSDGAVYGDDREELQRFEVTGTPEAYIQTCDWEQFVIGDFGSMRAVNIQRRRIPVLLLEQIWSKGDFPDSKTKAQSKGQP